MQEQHNETEVRSLSSYCSVLCCLFFLSVFVHFCILIISFLSSLPLLLSKVVPFVRSVGRSFFRSVVRSFGRSFDRLFVWSFGRSVVRLFILLVFLLVFLFCVRSSKVVALLMRAVEARSVACSWVDSDRIPDISAFWETNQGSSDDFFNKSVSVRRAGRFVSHSWSPPDNWREVMGSNCSYYDLKFTELQVPILPTNKQHHPPKTVPPTYPQQHHSHNYTTYSQHHNIN